MMLAGFDIHQIIQRMNMMIGVIEVNQKVNESEISMSLSLFLFLLKGYAVAIGNFNDDDNQGRSIYICSLFI